MKIAINALPVGPGMTGIGTFTRTLVNSTLNFGGPHECVYFTPAKGGEIRGNGNRKFRQVRVENPSRMWEELHLPTELGFWEVDLYHSPLFTCPIVKQVQSVITIHDVIPESHPEFSTQEFIQFYKERIGPSLRAADFVITTTDYAKSEIVKYLDIEEAKIHKIDQAVSPLFSPEYRNNANSVRVKFGLPEKYILYVGMIEPRKNVARLVEAFGKIARDYRDFGLVLVGRKDDEKYPIEKTIEETGASDRVFRLGYLSDDELAALYAGAYVFAFPSLAEGFGMPVIEAMASGAPVVTSNTSSLPEITDRAALLVDPENVEAIANGIMNVLQNGTLRENLCDKGFERAKFYSVQKYGERLANFYSEVERLQCV